MIMNNLEGKRIKLISMPDDPDPITPGSEGTILFNTYFEGANNIAVNWDSGRRLSLISPPDKFIIIDDNKEL